MCSVLSEDICISVIEDYSEFKATPYNKLVIKPHSLIGDFSFVLFKHTFEIPASSHLSVEKMRGCQTNKCSLNNNTWLSFCMLAKLYEFLTLYSVMQNHHSQGKKNILPSSPKGPLYPL